MAEKHTPRECFTLYQSGWKTGAAQMTRSTQREGDLDYEKGYADGCVAYSEAMNALWRLGAPEPSVLREDQRPQYVRDTETQHDAEMFAELERKGIL